MFGLTKNKVDVTTFLDVISGLRAEVANKVEVIKGLQNALDMADQDHHLREDRYDQYLDQIPAQGELKPSDCLERLTDQVWAGLETGDWIVERDSTDLCFQAYLCIARNDHAACVKVVALTPDALQLDEFENTFEISKCEFVNGYTRPTNEQQLVMDCTTMPKEDY